MDRRIELSLKTISTVMVELVLLIVLGYPNANALRAPIIIIAFVWTILRRGRYINFKNIYFVHLFWGISFLALVLLSRYWALFPQGIDDIKHNVIWCVLLTLIVSDYVVFYRKTIEDIAKLMIPAALLIVIVTILNGSMTIQNRLSISFNENAYGMICIGMFCYFFYCYISKYQYRRFYIILSIILLLFSLLSGSRKVILSLLVYLIGLFQFREHNKLSKKNLLRIVILFAVLILCYWLIMNVSFLYSTIGNRIDSFLGFVFREEEGDGSVVTRMNMLLTASNIIKSNLWLGIGANNFKYVTIYNTYSHNGYTEIICSFGILGIVIYYFPVIKMLLDSLKNWKSAVKDSIFPLCVFISFFLCEIGSVSYFTYHNYCYLGLAAGLCFCMKNYSIDSSNRIGE